MLPHFGDAFVFGNPFRKMLETVLDQVQAVPNNPEQAKQILPLQAIFAILF